MCTRGLGASDSFPLRLTHQKSIHPTGVRATMNDPHTYVQCVHISGPMSTTHVQQSSNPTSCCGYAHVRDSARDRQGEVRSHGYQPPQPLPLHAASAVHHCRHARVQVKVDNFTCIERRTVSRKVQRMMYIHKRRFCSEATAVCEPCPHSRVICVG